MVASPVWPMPDTRSEIVGVLRDVLGPLVRADGGRLYMVQVDATLVRLHLAGRYSGCPGNTLATRRIIEPALFAVAPGVRVEVTSGAILPENAELLVE